MIIRTMMNWYASRDDYSAVIVRGMHRANGGDRKRKRILDNVPINGGGYNDDKIRALWNACGEMGTFGALINTL